MILHTSVIGEGDPIVFLHSGLQTGESDFNYQCEHFRKNYKVILPDLRGHGKSKVNQIDVVNFLKTLRRIFRCACWVGFRKTIS